MGTGRGPALPESLATTPTGRPTRAEAHAVTSLYEGTRTTGVKNLGSSLRMNAIQSLVYRDSALINKARLAKSLPAVFLAFCGRFVRFSLAGLASCFSYFLRSGRMPSQMASRRHAESRIRGLERESLMISRNPTTSTRPLRLDGFALGMGTL